MVSDLPQMVGKTVRVCGWVQTVRAHGKVIFFDLRDKSGIIQTVFIPKNKDFEIAKEVRSEWVVAITGMANERPPAMVNDQIATGKIELFAEGLEVYSKAETLPISIDGDGYEISEEHRLKYRYIDLRRARLHRNLIVRHKVINFMRQFLTGKGFVEVETPLLIKSTPEGAREFLVPSRLQPGNFYAMPQSPQQFKQLLMVSGVERYFQIARCMRDEDPRADRQAEHTQLDMEMSFMSQGEILDITENLYTAIIKTLFPEKTITQTPFPRLTWQQAQDMYGSDKPDMRKDKNNPDEIAFGFIVDFPMFEWLPGDKKWKAMHHPFTMPQTENVDELKSNTAKVLGYQYDLVANGYELGSGSIRNTNMDLFKSVCEIVGVPEAEARKKFSHYFEAFSYGVPPHGGMAPGIDRFLAVVLNEPNIREVIAFPKTGDNKDLMLGAPSEVSAAQLKELGICLDLKKTAEQLEK
ncbi:MAG: aspartate--tRNA ligase [Candidatus Paceibacterota bacterium]